VFSLNKTFAKIKGLISLFGGQSITQGYFYDRKFQDMFNRFTNAEKYDSVFCFSSPMAEYIFKNSRKKETCTTSLIMDFCDLDSDKWHQYAQNVKFPLHLIYGKEASRLLEFEKKINKSFNKSIFISHREEELFREYYPEAQNTQIIANGVDHEFFDPDRVTVAKEVFSPMIMFSGAMDYYANIDGVVWFVEKILPEIRTKIPNLQFYIVGSNPAPAVKALARDPSVIVTGFVDDIRGYYQAADLCVIPLRIARGVQNKVLEAMSMTKAVVSTSQAVQGISKGVKDVLVVEDNPVDLAEKIIGLLQDETKRKELGNAARRFVVQNYDWDRNLAGLVKSD
jgi:sugar transferase (PEP-CTERM/EpsH1 system associated)